MHFWDYVLTFFETLGMRLFGSAIQTATKELQRAGVSDADIDALEQILTSVQNDPAFKAEEQKVEDEINRRVEEYLHSHGLDLDSSLLDGLLALLHHENMIQAREHAKNQPPPQKQGTQSP